MSGGDSAVGRSEKAGVNHFGGAVCIFQVFTGGGNPAVRMGPGVVANGMAFCKDRIIYGRVFFNIPAKAEKSGFGIMFGQQLKDTGRGFGMGSVIKGEEHGLLLPGEGEADPGENAVGDICYLSVKHLYS